jgi:MFS family permease
VPPDFRRLWLGESVSLVGSRLTEFALPLIALITLHANAAQLGLLSALQFGPIAVGALPAGVLVERCRKRRLMLVANLGRAAVYGAVPLLAVAGLLSLTSLAVVALAGGALTAVFDVAYGAYLPVVVPEDALVRANAQLEGSAAIAEVSGQGLGGAVVQALGPICAPLFDAATYLFSASLLMRMTTTERVPAAAARRSPAAAGHDLWDGLRSVFGPGVLRPVMLQSAWLNALLQVAVVVVPVYALRGLGLSPAALGFVLAAGSAGSVAGCALADALGRRCGVSAALVIGMSLTCSAYVLLPLAALPGAPPALTLGAGYVVYGFGLAVFNVHSLSLRVAVTPPELLGRTLASYRFVTWAPMPLGALAGGALAELVGAPGTLIAVAAGLSASAAAFAWRFRHAATAASSAAA